MNDNEQIQEMAKCCTYHHNGECCADATNISECDLMCEMFGVFTNLKKENYRKVERGEWEIAIGYDPKKKVKCTACGLMDYEPRAFCPHCGADMRGENNAM